ncbi:MAG: hypothetical protein AAF937_04075 [Planctomycetota bacterium]
MREQQTIELRIARDILGERLISCLSGPPGRERRAACACVDSLRSLLNVYEAATGRLRATTADQLVVVVYRGSGPLFRSALVSQRRLSGHIARCCARLHELAGEDATLWVCGSATLPGEVIAAQPAVDKAAGDGILLVAGGAARAIANEPSSLDVVPSLLAALGIPAAADLPGSPMSSALRSPPDEVFSHHRMREDQTEHADHPEHRSLARLKTAGLELRREMLGPTSALLNEACLAACAIAEGRRPRWHVPAGTDLRDVPPVLLLCGGLTAAAERDADALSEVLGGVPAAMRGGVFYKAAQEVLTGLRGDVAAACRRLQEIARDDASAAEHGDADRATLALAFERLGAWSDALRLWTASSRDTGELGRARCLLKLDDHDGAIASARLAIERDPLSDEAHAVLILSLRHTRDAAAFEAAVRSAVDAVPSNTFFQRTLVRLLRRSGRHTEASALERARGDQDASLDLNSW